MSSSSRNFDALRRLLSLKRHEVPPPGYFQGFSSQVLSRIEAGERGEPASLIARWLEGAPWLQRLRGILEAQPAFAGAFGAVACALLISGILYSESGGQPNLMATTAIAGETPVPGFDGMAPIAMNSTVQPVEMVSSTNPVAPVTASLFDQIQLPTSTRASFTIPGGN